MRPWLALLVLVPVLAFAEGEPPSPPAAPAAPADPVQALRARCRYAATPFEMTVKGPFRVGGTQMERLEFPSPCASVDPERNDVVKAKLFRKEDSQPALVVFLGGWRFDPATPALAQRLAQETPLQTLVVELPFQGERAPRGRASGDVTFSADLEQNQATFVQAAQDVERAVRWMVAERKIDPKRVGVAGTSLGGFVASDLYGMTDLFSCAAVLISGGDVASVIFSETNWLTDRIRTELAAKGLDEKTVRERMKPLDPITWARKERRDGLLLVAAEHDEIVPLPTVKALAEAYGGARLVVMPGATHINPEGLKSHFPVVAEHFAERLLAKEPAGAGR